MRPSTVLRKARKLIERGWCKFALAIDREGREVYVKSRKAVSFCALGAIIRARPENFEHDPQNYLRQLTPFGSIAEWNNEAKDKRTILRLFDRAIKLAESEGK